MAQVQILNIEKQFEATRVLRGVSVDIDEGEFTVLVGPSGCGKTTLLRMIAGLEDITSGEIRIGGKVVNDVLPKDRDIAMVFQNYALYPHMKVRDNMGFSLKLSKVPKGEVQQRVAQAAEILHLGQLLDRYPRQLSGGQRQRVAMGRCIVRKPQVFLFDEPLSNLDAMLRVSMRAEIRELHQRLKTTTIYVTHDQVEAMTMADNIVVMREGLIEQNGPPLHLYDEPANLFVAGFIGSPAMNFLRGTAHPQAAGVLLRLEGGESLTLPRRTGLAEGQTVVLGVRPEHLSIGREGLAAEVSVVESTGLDSLLHCRTTAGAVNVLLRERTSLQPGQHAMLQVDVLRAHLFDAGTGKRIGSDVA
ncbi:MAG: sn-glycerol-3-phosphate ABC transporter ATP-binding protein UgpC [Betaproteobacteria bacterium]|nr:sn-glycerol-3-phosphate ABC transporter ATP-binding protein UgpC [Betaproteobacteria bacterium]